jgi:hypothetical protein
VNNRMARWIRLAMIVISWPSCTSSSSCPPPAYQPGDKFRITVNKRISQDAPCNLITLNAGDVFYLTVGMGTGGASPSNCYWYSATPRVPSFADGVLQFCSASEKPLGLNCVGSFPNGCKVSMSTAISIANSDMKATVEHAVFSIQMSNVAVSTNNVSCAALECEQQSYDVRLEELPADADAGD